MLKKKRKISKDITHLCEDEIRNLLPFLTPNEIVAFSLINKQNFQNIFTIAKNVSAEVVHEPWNIKEAFGNSKMVKFKYTGLFQEDAKIFQEKKSLIEELYTGYYKREIHDLLSTVEIGAKIELPHLQLSENGLEQKRINKWIDKTFGHKLKKLIVHFPNDLDIYQILQNVPFLEDLTVILRPEPLDEENYEVEVPILEKLENLAFYHCSQYDESFFFTFLSLCPNLKRFKISTERFKINEPFMQTLLDFKPSKNVESFSDDDDFICEEKYAPIGTLFTNVGQSDMPLIANLNNNLPMNDFMLNYLLNFKNLRIINIESNRDFIYLRSDIKEESLANLINNLPFLEELSILDTLHVNGTFFKNLKENKSLVKLDLHREIDLIVDSLMEEDYYFQSKFHKLKSLKLYGFNNQKLWLSLFINCTKLETLTNYEKSSNMKLFIELLKDQKLLTELKNLSLFWEENDKKELEFLRKDIELLDLNDLN